MRTCFEEFGGVEDGDFDCAADGAGDDGAEGAWFVGCGRGGLFGWGLLGGDSGGRGRRHGGNRTYCTYLIDMFSWM